MLNPLLAIDFYKVDHRRQYPKGTTKVYSNLTPRSARLYKGKSDKVVVFGIQMFIKDFLLSWNDNFFSRPKSLVCNQYKVFMQLTLGISDFDVSHIEALHDLGYLPIEIKALPEGTRCPIKVPILTITNTVDEFYWIVNYVETVMSAELWKPITNATIAADYRQAFETYAATTGVDTFGIQFQGHDFSARGLSNREDQYRTQISHLTSFTGTDTVLAIQGAIDFYNADISKELVGTSVPATEHSVSSSRIFNYERQIDELLAQNPNLTQTEIYQYLVP